MIYTTTKLETVDDESIEVGELANFIKKSPAFADIYSSFQKIEKLAGIFDKRIEDLAEEVNKPLPRHKHEAQDVDGLFTEEEAKLLIEAQAKDLRSEINNLRGKIDSLPKDSKPELESLIKTIKADLEKKISQFSKPSTTTNIINQVEEARLIKLEKTQQDLIGLLDGVVSKAEDELKEVQDKLLLELSNRIKEGDKKVTIVGGINIGERLKLLKDVKLTNPQNNDVLKYDSALNKWVNGASSGIQSIQEGTNILVDNADPANPIVGLDSAAQASLALADTALQSGDNVSELVNDAGYLTSESDTLATVTGRGASTSTESTFSGGLITNQVKANSSAGIALKSNNGTAVAEFGAGGGGNWTFEDGVKLNAGTAERILATDSSKNIQYLSTATYPSLTELSYVKGVTSAIQTQINSKESALTISTGLTRSTNTITNNLSTGVSGGQTLIGGTASGNNLTIQSTSHATKGKILFGTSAYDEVNNRFGIGTTSPTAPLHIVSSTFGGGNNGNVVIQDSSASGINSAHLISLNDSGGTRQAYIYKEGGSGKLEIKNEQSAGVIQLTPNNVSQSLICESVGTWEGVAVVNAGLRNLTTGGSINMGVGGSAGCIGLKPGSTGVTSGLGMGIFWNNINVFGTNDFFFQGNPGSGSTGMMVYEGYNSVATVFSNYSFAGGTTGYIAFAPQRTEKIRISNDGKLGINTTAPAYLLDVNGTANATDYRVGGAAGASGTFTTADAKTVTVTNGIITGIV